MNTIEWMENMPISKIRALTKQAIDNQTESYKQGLHRVTEQLCDEIEAYERIIIEMATKHPETAKSLNVELPRSAEELINSIGVDHIKVS